MHFSPVESPLEIGLVFSPDFKIKTISSCKCLIRSQGHLEFSAGSLIVLRVSSVVSFSLCLFYCTQVEIQLIF